jgi:hypothetical protein
MDWSTLKHAYGNASDVPALLSNLSRDPHSSVWEELWSRLCHQGTVYSASFAALPVLVDVAEQWIPKDRSQLIALAASILASQDVHGGCRDEFLRPVAWVVPRFQRFCRESFGETALSKHDFIYLLQASRSFEGDQFWGQELDHLASGEFPGTCPHCGIDLYLVIGEYGLFTTAEEWVMRSERPRTELGTIKVRPGIKCTPIEPNSGILPEVGQQLCECAQAAQQHEVAEWIRHLFGTSVCPSCGRAFELQKAIAVH